MSVTTEVSGWLAGLAAMGCTFVECNPNAKKPKRKLSYYVHQVGQTGHCSALAWLGQGSGVGILPKAPLWVLDADSAERVAWIESILLDAQIIPLKIITPSGGAHFYFLFPDGFRFEGLKCHLNHPMDEDGLRMAVDFKLGSRTMLVAPGTIRRGKQYEPASPWITPPIVNPQMFLPNGEFWLQPRRPFLVDLRPEKDRIIRARAYLKRSAPVSISGASGNRTLAGVAAHLVAYLRLKPEMAHSLMLQGEAPWNKRCTFRDGTPYPWTDVELHTACIAAVSAVPAAGVKAYDRQKAAETTKMKLASLVTILKGAITAADSVRVPVEKVLQAFEWMGLPDLTAIALGDELVVQGVRRIRATHARVWCIPGLNFVAMQNQILDADRDRQDQDRHKWVCPLLRSAA